jgi:hypothetical protein
MSSNYQVIITIDHMCIDDLAGNKPESMRERNNRTSGVVARARIAALPVT